MKRSHLAALVVAALLVGAVVSFRVTYEPDLFWHLAQGRELAAGRLVRTNLFSALHADYPQPYTSWLFDLGVHLLSRAGGAVAIQLAQTLVIALALGLAFAGSRRAGGSTGAALAVLALGIFAVEPRALPRPHLFSFAGIAACALLVEEARRRQSARPLWWGVPIIALWSNVHVESLFGVALLGLFAVAELLRPSVLVKRESQRAIAAATVCGLATLCTPYGSGIIRYLVENAAVPQVIRIAELQPPYLAGYAPFFLLLGATVVLLALRPKELALWELVVAAAFAALALRHLRFTALFLFATAPMVARRVAGWLADDRRRARAAVVTSLVAGALLCRQPPTGFLTALGAGDAALANPDLIPMRAAAFARTVGLDGPLFNSNNLGGALALALYPNARVFQDSRLQAYPAQHFRDIMDAARAQPAWNRLVAGVDWAVLSRPRPNELSGAGRFPASEWATVYWDDAAEILVRRAGRFGALAERFEYKLFRPGVDPFAASTTPALLDEARRHERDDPRGFGAPALLCLSGADDACERALRLARNRPELRRAADRLARRRSAP